jgi:hypothetical protein
LYPAQRSARPKLLNPIAFTGAEPPSAPPAGPGSTGSMDHPTRSTWGPRLSGGTCAGRENTGTASDVATRVANVQRRWRATVVFGEARVVTDLRRWTLVDRHLQPPGNSSSLGSGFESPGAYRTGQGTR